MQTDLFFEFVAIFFSKYVLRSIFFTVCLVKVEDALIVDAVEGKVNDFDIIPLSFRQSLALRSIDFAFVFICVYLLIVRDLIRVLQLL